MKIKRNIKLWGIAILFLLGGIFIFQNWKVITIKFLFWQLMISQSLILAIVLLIGLGIGSIGMYLFLTSSSSS